MTASWWTSSPRWTRRSPKPRRSPIAEAVIQAYADDYTAGSLRQPSDVEVAAALRYLLRQGLLREGITIMAAKFAVAGMCSAMAEALEKEES